MADIVEIAHQRHIQPHGFELFADMGHGGRRFGLVDGDAHQFRARPRQQRHLCDGRVDIGGVGVGHRLHHHRGAAANLHLPHHDAMRMAPAGYG